MEEETIMVPTADGSMECFAAYPSTGSNHPVVVIYMDAPGIRGELYDFTRRIAEQGYFCILPDLYYRHGVRFDMHMWTEEDSNKMFEMLRIHTNAMIVSDTQGMLDYLATREEASDGPMGCIGYCMSGQFVLSVIGNFPDRFKAMVSMYGVSHVTDAPDSPHLVADKLLPDCELYFGFAGHDPYVPDEEIEILAQTFEEKKVNAVVEKVPGTEHGFAFPERMAYNHEMAERHWDIAFDLFGRKLR